MMIKLENIYCKVDNVKDRVVRAMIDTVPDCKTIIMATTGKTGDSCKAICSQLGLKSVIFGSDEGGMKAARQKAKLMAESTKGAVFLDHFTNEACVNCHRDYTAVEIWQDLDGKIDVFVAGVGTGASFTGCAELLKAKNPNIYTVAVEPAESAVLSGGEPGLHNIPGLGAGFIPPLFDFDLCDEIITVSSEEALQTSERMSRLYGLSCSVSSGAVFSAALKLSERKELIDKNIVALLPA